MTRHLAKLALIALCGLAPLAGVGIANADPDPYHPDWSIGWCPGGGTIRMGATALPNIGGLSGHCDGIAYPDGSFWHQVPQSPSGFSSFGVDVEMFCRVGLGQFITTPAPAGGCGGEA
jgi:hypothetical protein